MGPNGSGKSTLSHTLMGHPGYTVDGGEVIFKGKNVLALEVDERARLGMFLALQYPVVVPGISMTNFLRTALNAKRGYDGKDKSKQISPKEFRSMLKDELEVLHMDDSFLPRYRLDQVRRRRRQPHARPRARRPDHYALHPHPGIHQARLRARACGREICNVGWPRGRRSAGENRLLGMGRA